MNREIKFRIWDTDAKEMRYNTSYNAVLKEFYWRQGGYTCSVPGGMQYTGLKDKSGKEIYEGDIIRIYDLVNFKIEWDDYQAQLNTESYRLEIVGNIYENPELLGE